MADLADGESTEMQGSGAKPYVLKNTGGVYSCSCPAWRNQSIGIERRTCKHLKKLRGEAAELERIGSDPPEKVATEADGEDATPKVDMPLLLAESWKGDLDITGWWMSEKLDGVRAYWNGTTFLSRLGNEFFAPEWFTKGLPSTPLDGELWLDRKKFQRAVSIVRRRDRSEHWRELKYLVFDVPEMSAPFEERTAYLADQLGKASLEYVLAHRQEQCRGVDHLREELARVEKLGGEGLMLRQPGSKYAVGRSSTLLKVKQFLDGEARVIEHVAGAGRHKGRMGALVCELEDGKQFSIGTGFSDAQRGSPPASGAIVAFRYQELSEGGIPRFPAFAGVRIDAPVSISSEDLVMAAEKGKKATKKSTAAKSASAPPAAAKAAKSSESKPAAKKTAPTPEPKPAVAPPSTGGSTNPLRYFEFVDEKSNKFWEISRTGTEVKVRYGRIGTDGQNNVKTFADEAQALKHYTKLLEEKTGKGYQEKTQ